jgi:hypothetical protein
MEQTPFELTPAHRGLLATLSRETGKPIPAPTMKPLWEIAADLLKDVPQEVLDRLPTDGAAQHDHYIYGTPKRVL